MECFSQLIYPCITRQNCEDKLVWQLAKKAILCEVILSLNMLGDLISFTSKEICAWATCSKVMFLCVGGYRMKIFTIDLMIRGCSLMNICWMCELKEETTNHIFIHFEWASRLWYLLFFLFFVRWVLLNGVNKLLLGSSS